MELKKCHFCDTTVAYKLYKLLIEGEDLKKEVWVCDKCIKLFKYNVYTISKKIDLKKDDKGSSITVWIDSKLKNEIFDKGNPEKMFFIIVLK